MVYKNVVIAVCVASTALIAPVSSAGGERRECFEKRPTIVGTPGDDVLIGREDTADVIMGLGGNDRIQGSEDFNARIAPGDRLCGGSGKDRIQGGVGEDRIQGGANDDDVDGSFGYDIITQGGPGNDRVTDCDSEYTGGVRIIKGNSGNDHLCVNTDATEMHGNAGRDELIDGTCSAESTIRAGHGRDQIESYDEHSEGTECSNLRDDGDDLFGGPGPDEAIVSPNDDETDIEVIETR